MSSYTYREHARGPEFYTGPTFSNRNARPVLLPRGYAPECFNDGDAASSQVRDRRAPNRDSTCACRGAARELRRKLSAHDGHGRRSQAR
jgi:hypothetical protein